jgi:hypothetical protein
LFFSPEAFPAPRPLIRPFSKKKAFLGSLRYLLRYLLDKAESGSYNKIKVATMTELKT